MKTFHSNQPLIKGTNMSLKFRIAALTLLVIAWSSGVVFSQITGDPGKEFNQAFYNELQTSEDEMRQFGQSLQPLFEDLGKNIAEKTMPLITERMRDTSSPPTPEEMMKLSMGIAMDEMIGMQKPINDKATEFFSEEGRQKMHLRLFQVKTGLIERLGATDDTEAVHAAFGFDMLHLMGGQPDFLELSPEQRELITQQQKETFIEAMTLTTQATMKMITANPGKLAEIQRLAGELQEAKTDEEREEITKKLQATNVDIYKDIAPELKTILIKGHEDFMRVLTDAQKAKIKAVMTDMPDYVKNLLAEVNKGGNALSGLESWVPGAGVPGINPNREAPRQRTGGGGGRAFSE